MTARITEQRPPSASEVYIRTFGSLELENSMGRVTESGARKTSQPWLLLKYLLVNRDREVELDELLGTIWPDARSVKSESAVRVRLTRLRAALEPIGLGGKHGLIVHHLLKFSLNPDYVIRTDAEEFTTLLTQLKHIPPEDPCALILCVRALELFRGPYMQYTNEDFWFESIRKSYHEDFRTLALSTVDRINATGTDEALPLLGRRALVLAAHDLELHRAVLNCYSRFSRETERRHHATQLMRSGVVADWLSHI